jgi:hypothetical protein
MCSPIREFGFNTPVLARSDGEVVDGHLRLKGACKLGLTEIPVILCDEWTPAQVKAFRLMVNRSAVGAVGNAPPAGSGVDHDSIRLRRGTADGLTCAGARWYTHMD